MPKARSLYKKGKIGHTGRKNRKYTEQLSKPNKATEIKRLEIKELKCK